MHINFLHNTFQKFNKFDKEGSSVGEYEFGFENTAIFEEENIKGQAHFVVSLLKHLANPSWTFSNEKAEKALRNYFSTIDTKKMNTELNLLFLLENDEFFPLE